MSKRREKPKDTRELAALFPLLHPSPFPQNSSALFRCQHSSHRFFRLILPIHRDIESFHRPFDPRFRAIKYYAIDCKGTIEGSRRSLSLFLSISGSMIFEFKIGGRHPKDFALESYQLSPNHDFISFPARFWSTSTVRRIDKRVNSIELMNFYSLRLLFSLCCTMKKIMNGDRWNGK